MKHNIASLLQKIRNGDSLTTPQIQAVNDHTHRVTNDLLQMGPTFRLAANEAQRLAYLTDDWLAARKKS